MSYLLKKKEKSLLRKGKEAKRLSVELISYNSNTFYLTNL